MFIQSRDIQRAIGVADNSL